MSYSEIEVHGSKILIGDVLGKLPELLPKKRVIVITDATIHRLYSALVNDYEHIIMGVGESNKTMITVSNIYRQLIEKEADREVFILAIGGGIVTDTAGFVASTYMRGVDFGFIATTLLSQVDASVGGKNGVNVDGYKNMVGTFNQPSFVLCDISMLGSLPDREFRAGLAEIIKAGVVADTELFALFEKHTYKDFKSDKKLLTEVITRAVQVKANIVKADEREMGERKKLNLGHTFAHSIEKCSMDFIHGEAVAAGLCMISKMSEELVGLPKAVSARIVAVVENMGLLSEVNIDRKRLLTAITKDKKRDKDNINIVAVKAIGECEIVNIPIKNIR